MMLKMDADTENKPGRRVVMLEATWETQKALHEWAESLGFNLAWSHSGWPQRSRDFGFHVTVVATANPVSIPVTWRSIEPLTLVPTGFEVLGDDTPTLRLEAHNDLEAMRAFFVETFGAQPTYPDFKPHVSLSYRWSGSPSLEGLPLPPFPLDFDALIVAELEEAVAPAKTGDASPVLLAVTDKAAVSGTRRTRDGYLVADARVARTGIQEYLGFEVGKPELGSVKVYRPESEVFAADALRTYAFRPVTIGHPAEGVTADNWRKEAVGTTGAEVARDGEHVRVPLVLMDAGAIAEVEAGVREISMGYECRLDWTPGVTADGQNYDAVQRGLRMNHLAVVEKGRAGSACRIGDGGNRAAGKQEIAAMVKLTVDGISYELSDQGAELVKKLQGDVASLSKRASDAEAAVADAAKARDTAIGERDVLKTQIPTADALDKLVADRSALIGAASKLCPDGKFAGMTADAIRAHVVKAKLGDASIKDRSVEYVTAAFDTLVGASGGAKVDPVADALRGSPAPTPTNDARSAYLNGLQNAWSGGAK